MKFIYYLSKIIRRIKISSIINSFIDKKAVVCYGSNVVNSEINSYSYIGSNSTIIEAKIGKFCSIADNVIIGGGKHPIDWVSTSPVFYSGKNIFKQNFSNEFFLEFEKTTIGNDVWIGSNSIIKGGVNIGDGSIVGMGSIVTKNIPPYEIWGGNPAKCIKKRFSESTINDLLEIKWWEKDEFVLKKYKKYNDVNEFILFLKGEEKNVYE